MPDLPDPDVHPHTDVVLYDGECSFCCSQVANLRRLDRWGAKLSYLSLHDPRVSERYPDLSSEDLMRQMYVIDTRDRRHGGADAVRYLTRRLPMLWPAAPILHLPCTARLWRWLYDQFALRRYRISGKICDNGRCKIDR
ncbi:thiol-disulfide oxidoreductase DCC family protein [Novipirellula artificiosorum]|uniref:Thiol-disulfide oxidoreductase n=1 Tax=Novipirellula artificiosorum TaxID=2528016 RepID=A0A5C6DVT9_9BACT|nr:DUF393 domain-containing protein [Novipirellula artificiosorum]TWU40768.1 hypothetical protein Poly41_16030 [Novipirellula artificiosorum]